MLLWCFHDLGFGKNCVPAMKVLSGAGYKEEGSRNAAVVEATVTPPPPVAVPAVIKLSGCTPPPPEDVSPGAM
jgi:hypothetical protein